MVRGDLRAPKLMLPQEVHTSFCDPLRIGGQIVGYDGEMDAVHLLEDRAPRFYCRGSCKMPGAMGICGVIQ